MPKNVFEMSDIPKYKAILEDIVENYKGADEILDTIADSFAKEGIEKAANSVKALKEDVVEQIASVNEFYEAGMKYLESKEKLHNALNM